MILLHPTHPLFRQNRHPVCPECQREILPGQAVSMEYLDDGRIMFRHAECAEQGAI